MSNTNQWANARGKLNSSGRSGSVTLIAKLFVPTGTPKEIVDLLHRKVVALVATPDVKAKLATIGFAPSGDTPAEFTAFLKAEDEKWGKVVRDAGIKIE